MVVYLEVLPIHSIKIRLSRGNFRSATAVLNTNFSCGSLGDHVAGKIGSRRGNLDNSNLDDCTLSCTIVEKEVLTVVLCYTIGK